MTDTSVRPPAETVPTSPIPRRTSRPGWLDTRLVFGVALVLGSVLMGATVFANADRRSPVWALSHDVAAGTVLTSGDLAVARVQLGSSSGRYLPTSQAVVGQALRSDAHAGELLTRASVTAPASGVTVTIPVRPENAPKLDRGDRITVWVSSKTCRGVVVLSGVPVQDIRQGNGSSFGTSSAMGLVVSLAAPDAQRVISALDLDGALVRAGVLAEGEAPAAVQSLDGCNAAAK